MQWNEWYNNVSAQEKQIMDNMTSQEREDAFKGELEFGTAGMRGIMGIGSNRMNKYNVAKVTEALAQIFKEQGAKKIAISYDTRFNSKGFAQLAACICAKHGLTVYIADTMPTPFLSFMVRYYHCDCGIMITASHNSKEYNGYKAYDETGCQILPELANKIVARMADVNIFKITMPSFEELKNKDLIIESKQDCVNAFWAAITNQSRSQIHNITAVYSALNGTGIKVVPALLKNRGVNVVENKTQCTPDPNFKTCPSPNPEKPEVYTLSREIAKKHNADLILCTDPDSDRLGVEALHNGQYVHLTGNEVGILLCDYLLSHSARGGSIMRSIVSTSLVDKIAQKYGANTKVVLTGFKYIGEYLNELEKQNRTSEFVFGFEESCSYLAGDYIREKDATVTAMLVCELASICKQYNKTIVDHLNEIYKEFGYCKHKVVSYRFEGAKQDVLAQFMEQLRTSPLKVLGGLKVLEIIDFKDGINDLPKANMLLYKLEQNAMAIFRPSGTEPLVKVYLTTYKNDNETDIQANIIEDLNRIIKINKKGC